MEVDGVAEGGRELVGERGKGEEGRETYVCMRMMALKRSSSTVLLGRRRVVLEGGRREYHA